MKIIFLGLGSIGRRHLELLRKYYRYDLYAYRSGVNSKISPQDVKELDSWKEIENIIPDIAFITNPTFLHIKTALKCAQLGCKLFIEKPIGMNSVGLDKLVDIVRRKQLVTYVAYNLRFHPIIQLLLKEINKGKVLHIRTTCSSYLPNWRPGVDCLKSYSANKKMGGGVVLDLSHEIDYIDYLTGGIKNIKGQFGRRSNITNDSEDFADVSISSRLCPVNLHLDYFSHLKERTIKIDFLDKSLVGDLVNNEIIEYKEGVVLKKKKIKYNISETYRDQMKYFFQNIKNPRMTNNLIDAVPLYKKFISFKINKNG